MMGVILKGQLCSLRGGPAFFRVIISFGLGPAEVAPYMTGTFYEVFGPRNQTGSEPRPARKKVPKIAITLRGSNRVKWGTKLSLSFS